MLPSTSTSWSKTCWIVKIEPLFGAYDGYEIVCFDDQIGAHGAAGGSQLHPFIIGPRGLGLEDAVLEDARDLHGALLSKYARPT